MFFLFVILVILTISDAKPGRNEFPGMGNPNGYSADTGVMAEYSIEMADYTCLQFYNNRHEGDEGTGVSKQGCPFFSDRV